jgi:hypothetical protein
MPTLSPRVWIALAIGVAILLFWIALDQYGDRRYAQGEADTDAKWEQASDKLIEKAQATGKQADKAAAARTADHAARVAEEKEKLDEANATGGSPIDVLFGTDSR